MQCGFRLVLALIAPCTLIACTEAAGAPSGSGTSTDDTAESTGTTGTTGTTGNPNSDDPYCLEPEPTETPAGCPNQCGNGVVDLPMKGGCSEICDTQGSTCAELGYLSSGEVPCFDTCVWDKSACDSCASGGSIHRCITSELPEYRGAVSRFDIAARGDELGVLMTPWADETGGMLFARVNKDLEIISVTPCVDVGHGSIDLATLDDGWLAAHSLWVDGVGWVVKMHKFDLQGEYVEQVYEFEGAAQIPRFVIDDAGPLMVAMGDPLVDLEAMARKFSSTGELSWELELDFVAEHDGQGAWDAVDDGEGIVMLDQRGNSLINPLRLIRITDGGAFDWAQELPFPEGASVISLGRSASGFEVFFTNAETYAPMVMLTDPAGNLQSTEPLDLGFEFSGVQTMSTSGKTLLLSIGSDPGEFRITRYPDGADAAYTLAAGPADFSHLAEHARGETGTFLAWEEAAWPHRVKMAFVDEL